VAVPAVTRPILALTELVPGVYAWRRASNGGIAVYGARDGGRGLLLVDTGADDRAIEGLQEWIEHFDAAEVSVINTHDHRDHTWGNAALAARGARLLAPPAGAEPGHRWETWLNGLQVECIALPGHSPDSRAVIVRGVAFAGDAVYTPDILRRMAVPAFLDVERALASLDALEAWLTRGEAAPVPPSERWLVAGHGQPLRGSEAAGAVAATRAALEAALEALAEVMGPPSYGPAPAPDEEQVLEWLRVTGMSAQHLSSMNFWRRVAAGYAAELARRRDVGVP